MVFSQRGSLASVSVDRPRLAEAMQHADLDRAVLASPESVYYLTGYPTLPSSGNPILYSLKNVFPFSVVVDRDGTRHLLCWGFSLQDVDIDVDDVVAFGSRDGAFESLRQLVSSPTGGVSNRDDPRIGLESTVPHEIFAIVRDSAPRAELVMGTGVLDRLRRIKTEREVALLKRCAGIAEGALTRVIDGLAVGASRLEMTRLAKRSVLELGGDGVGHVTMNFGHANPEIAIDEPLMENALAVIDVGAKFEGYTSDCRRYAFAGDIPAVVAKGHADMCEVVSAVSKHLVPGTPYSKLVAAAREGYSRAGRPFPERFTHVGHGIGLETEEEWIDDDPHSVIEENMVVAIELYTSVAPYGNIGDEETYVVRRDGPERLSLLDTAIRQV